MPRFNFTTDKKSEAFCNDILAALIAKFNITPAEAETRLNRAWAGLKLVGAQQICYLETADYWANTIYYGRHSNWWMTEKERNQRGLPPLGPVPLT
jgi:hypothetical protein